MSVSPPTASKPSLFARVMAFAASPQAKRDAMLVVAAIGGALDAYHRIFG